MDALRLATFFVGDASTFESGIPGFGVLRGPFVIVELTYGGEHDGVATFDVAPADGAVLTAGFLCRCGSTLIGWSWRCWQ